MPIISMIWRRRPTSSGVRWTLFQVPEEAVLVDARARRKGDHLCVERVGLGQAAHRAGEVSDLARVNDTERQPNAGQGRRNSGFEAAGRLQYNKGDRQSLEADDQVVHPLALSWNTECLA